MLMSIARRVGVLVLAAVTVLAAGCEDIGINLNRPDTDVAPTTAQFQIDSEFIPNAQRIRLDTRPQWEHGRYAFQRGADRLLVISRTTSYQDPKTGQRYDKFVERVWITLPLSTPLGEKVVLEEFEREFLVGYDQTTEAQYYIQPFRVRGNLTLLEERPDSVLIQINMSVYPTVLPRWGLTDIVEVPIAPMGVHATYLSPEDMVTPVLAETVPTTRPSEADPTTPAPAADEGKDMGAAEPAAPDGPVDENALARSLPGKWETEGTIWRFQFFPNGQLAYSSWRGGVYSRFAHWGTWEVKNNYVVLSVMAINAGLNFERLKATDIAVAHLRMAGNNLVLRGEINHRGARQIHNLALRRSDFPDFLFPAALEREIFRGKAAAADNALPPAPEAPAPAMPEQPAEQPPAPEPPPAEPMPEAMPPDAMP